MKSFAFLFALVSCALATPLTYEQIPIGVETAQPGFSLDLNARRLVQFEGQEPLWMTELEKVTAVKCVLFDRFLNCHFVRSKPRLKDGSSLTCKPLWHTLASFTADITTALRPNNLALPHYRHRRNVCD